MIAAKESIQQAMLKVISLEERLSLSRDILEESLIRKVIYEATAYKESFRASTEEDLFCIAMATGTILKELDNGNTEYVSYPYLAELMNKI